MFRRILPLAACATCLLALTAGCTRRHYRVEADREVRQLVAEKNSDPRWYADKYNNFNVGIDPRSRYFDHNDPDRNPMPADDPASHQFMHMVYGKQGWKKWHRFGDRPVLENAGWEEHLPGYMELDEQGRVKLNIDSALRLAYIHSPNFQNQLETMYLSALDVSAERFRLDTQFFANNTTAYNHLGRLRPGGESNRLSTDTSVTMRRRFATAADLLVGFANQFVWEFTGADTNSTLSIVNFSFVQPLLRNAGRAIQLEQLTIVERNLLANLRALVRFRKGFFTQVAIGEQGTGGTSRRGGFFGGTGLTGFTGQGGGGFGGVGGATGFGGGFGGGGGGGDGGGAGFAGGGAGTVGGFIGLLQQRQQIRNTEAALALQLRTLSLLEAYLEAGVIDLVQVDQFRQNIESERANLLQAKNNLINSTERYLTGTLGLPPNVPVVLDDSLIEQFQLIDPQLTTLQGQLADFQTAFGKVGEMPQLEQVREGIKRAAALRRLAGVRLADVAQDLERLKDAMPRRESGMTEPEKKLFRAEIQTIVKTYQEFQKRFEQNQEELMELEMQLATKRPREVADSLVVWLTDFYQFLQELGLAQARARLERITVEPFKLDSDTGFQIALTHRLDLMNSRASLVDTWRLIEFNANRLKSDLSVALSGDIRTARNNPVSFRAPAGSLRASVSIDPPLTRLLERNNYRQSLIDYQRSRRGLIQGFDGVHSTLRQLLRFEEQLRLNLEIQRRAVAISIRRVDLTRETLNQPVPPPLPGQPAAQFGPTAALNLLTALSDLRNSQNNFMSVWIQHYATRMRLMRELGLMRVDDNGRWIEEGVPDFEAIDRQLEEMGEPIETPPPVPDAWADLAFFQDLPGTRPEPKPQPLSHRPPRLIAKEGGPRRPPTGLAPRPATIGPPEAPHRQQRTMRVPLQRPEPPIEFSTGPRAPGRPVMRTSYQPHRRARPRTQTGTHNGAQQKMDWSQPLQRVPRP